MGATGEKLDAAIESADERLQRAEQEAHDLIQFADGIEEAGMRVYAQRSRSVARQLIDIAADLRAERSARVSIQHERDAFERMAAKYAAAHEEAAA